MTKEHLLAIDNGTQSVRAMVFDLQGNMIAKSQVMIDPPYRSPQPGWAELDPLVFWNSVCLACQNLWEMPGVEKEKLAGVALTTQRGTVINVDKYGNPLRPAILWLDQRRTPGLKPVGGLWGMLFKLAGMKETAAYLQAEAEANWLNTYQNELWNATHKFLFLSGYLTHQLTGRFVDSIGCQVGYMPFDYKHLRWSSPSDWKWQALPVRPEMLPELVPSAGVLGEITPEAAAATGIPAGLPLIAAAGDKACEVIGSGCLEPNIACLSFGTTATINTTHKDYIEVIPLIPPYPSAIPGRYSLEVQIFRGYWLVSWFKQEFGMDEARLAAQLGKKAEELLDEMINAVPAGSQGLMLLPYWAPGLKIPGPEAKGAIIGFGDVHTRAHLYRSLLEGLSYGLLEGADRISKRSHTSIDQIRVTGGGAVSNPAVQLTADIFGLPATRPHVTETSGLGAAIDAAVGLGLHPDFETAIATMTRTGESFEPNPANHQIYNELYQRVYLKMYSQLKPLYEEIRDITGYPPKL